MSNLQQIYLMVNDLESSRKFYERVLELETREIKESSIRFETGNCELMLEGNFDPEVLDGFNLSPPPKREDRGQGAVIALQLTEDLNSVHKRAQRLHARFKSSYQMATAPRSVDWGEQEIMNLKDPDVYGLELQSSDE